MNNIDLVHAVSATFAQTVREQMSARIGLAPDVIQNAIGRSSAAVLAALIVRCATPDGKTSACTAIMSAAANPRIAEQLGTFVLGTASFKDLEASGDALSELSTGRRIAFFSDQVSQQTGVPPQAAHVLAAVATAVLCGLLKHHLLIEQATADDFAWLLHSQLPSITPFVTDALAHSLGMENAAHFIEAIRQVQIVAPQRAPNTPVYRPPTVQVSTTVNASTMTSAILFPNKQASTAPTAPAVAASSAAPQGRVEPSRASEPTLESPESPPATIAASAASAAPAAETVVRKPAVRRRRSRRRWSWLIILLAIGGGTTFAYEQTHPGFLKAALSPAVDPATATAPGPRTAVQDTPKDASASADKTSDATSVASAAAASSPAAATGASAASEVSGVVVKDESSGTAATASSLAFRVDESGVLHVAATVANGEQKKALLDFLNNKLGAGRFAAELVVMPVAHMDWLEHLDALFGLVSARGAELTLRPAHIEIAGLAPDKARESSERLKTAFGAPWQVDVFDAAERVDRTTEAFRREMAAVIDSGHPCAPTDVARVLNTQIVDFARSSGHVPASAKENLDEAALLLKTCSNVGHPLKIEIASFTDSMGNAQALVQLSQKRADAIRALFIADGVPAALVTAKGYGAANPVASDLTSIGRFANRRVEFATRG
ncbi:hypothetical protein BGV52_04840 [Burkholderia ubonensis]|uniref:OmpA family protein n=1 Tax=Burkholderia ubonensis TaxID=101571 RepID=UPI0008FE0D79|nr:OmpA family protein [Burkholderia ubonensis]OJB11885.1 hypothetical protein BGV52_04840 [Burkholderia ubonensis]